ncbi:MULTISPECIES: UDP-glucose 4-epimerase GalE [Microbacterium]|uniref:UDP-glucose 4-epimerase n=1 Tax=Microbacterium wangchenii TaxID=2541726 RepID=A0ABX5SXR7_9MICO|nr:MULTISPECIES: UDP-glucose 4-epimerase GalE [Microbacterium]MCK6067461.1 UDP-glucose 4-epimerase GalE [Microbacterium sp. EYE_512]QBR89604.1 UDP-glucose 4-epimerase GalE [Microbacterium wangchenii]TFV80953.1 UDP-glucose 4-epimerase GalE [Microbacterium sp. dk485]TXK16797.1 UDP-glucose 4-epimerase GalE [Microbacterium wangchenii]
MRVLLAGGAGYIGAHTAVSLLDAGHEVVLLDDLSGTSAVAAERVAQITGKPAPLVVGDAADREVVEGVFAAHGPIDAIIHLAAFKAVGESTQIPLEYYRNNLDTTFALADVGVRHGIRSFVFSSTGTVYSDPADLPFTEEATTSVDLSNAYSKSKRMNEVVLADLARVNPELNVTVLRYFNPVGAHPSGLIGEDPAGIPNNLMPYVSRVAIGALEEIGIFGDDYDTPDGTGLRDYIHVVDLAEGHVVALEQAKPGYAVYNLGTGTPVSVRELIASFEKAVGRELPARVLPRRPGDVAATYCDPSKAARDLGWRTRLSIDDACRDYWNWQSHNPAGYATAR